MDGGRTTHADQTLLQPWERRACPSVQTSNPPDQTSVSSTRDPMTNVIPYSPALPLDLAHAPQHVETEPVSVRNVLGVILNRAPMALAVAVFVFLAVMLAVGHRTPQ